MILVLQDKLECNLEFYRSKYAQYTVVMENNFKLYSLNDFHYLVFIHENSPINFLKTYRSVFSKRNSKQTVKPIFVIEFHVSTQMELGKFIELNKYDDFVDKLRSNQKKSAFKRRFAKFIKNLKTNFSIMKILDFKNKNEFFDEVTQDFSEIILEHYKFKLISIIDLLTLYELKLLKKHETVELILNLDYGWWNHKDIINFLIIFNNEDLKLFGVKFPINSDLIFLIKNANIPVCRYFHQNYLKALKALNELKCSDIINFCGDNMNEEKKKSFNLLLQLGKIEPTKDLMSICLMNPELNLSSIIKF